MILREGKSAVEVGAFNWPLFVDVMIAKGFAEKSLNITSELKVKNLPDLLSELSAWGIPWKRRS